jgi:hypothetical protein
MNAASLYKYLEGEFPGKLYRSNRQDGAAFFWEQERINPSTRLVRIAETADGGVKEIKLAQSSLGGPDVIMPLPVSSEDVAEAVRHELRKLLSKSVS